MCDKLIETFCDVDDFCLLFFPAWEAQQLSAQTKKRRRDTQLSPSEIMTILIYFHQSHYKDFKNYYIEHLSVYLKEYFPSLVSYSRFIRLSEHFIVPMCSYLTTKLGKPTGIQFVDSTTIEVCHIIRAKRNKVFKDIAHHGKGTMGWSFGFKLHLIINHLGEIVALKLTKGNEDDRKPVPEMANGIFGKLYADKGYISNTLKEELFNKGVELITSIRKNMKKRLLSLWDRALLKKRFIIETVNDQLKSISTIEHTRHRSCHGFMLNLLGGLIAYSLKETKPSLDLTAQELKLLESNALVLA